MYAADGGGKVTAARRPVIGADKVAALMLALRHKTVAADASPGAWTSRATSINGEPALVAYLRGTLDSVFVFSTDAELITAIRVIRNPEKLMWLAAHRDLTGAS